MQDWLRKWYVSREEYLRMVQYHADEIAELSARVRELEDQLKIETMCSLDDFDFARSTETTPPQPSSLSNVLTVDFRRIR